MLDWETENIASVRSVLESFSGVWERVTGTPGAGSPRRTPPDGRQPGEDLACLQTLRSLSESAAEAARFDRELACRCRGTIRATLLAHAAQASHRAAALRGECFVRTGEKLRLPESCPRMGDALTSLRVGMLRDEASAGAYRRLAEQTDDRELRAALERFAAETAAAAAEKRQSILRCFT